MSQLFDSKSILAKCLAEENITIIHKKINTAYFDLDTRTITLPFWKEMDGDLYDLLMGHEVGHALYTPKKGWHDAVSENKALKSYLNVCEDARIERKQKERFPGLRRPFANAYKKLHEQDFFGLNALEVNDLLLIDRINIYFKLGAHVFVSFNEEELAFVERLKVADTWEDVEDIARELYEKALKDEQENPNQNKSKLMSGLDEIDDDAEELDFHDDDEYDQESHDSDDEENDEDLDQNQSNSESQQSNEYDDDEEIEEDGENTEEEFEENEDSRDNSVESITDKAQRMNEENLVDSSSGQVYVINTPKYDNSLVPHNKVYDKITSHINNLKENIVKDYPDDKKTIEFLNSGKQLYIEFLHRSKPVINYMIKEFEMRKNAKQLSRAKTSKSGKIDPRKLSRYKLDNDIFQKIMSVPGGQNHGLVIFIDLSGSMSGIIANIFEQAILLASFCKKINIPFDVYGFSDRIASAREFGLETNHIFNKKVNDMNLFSDGFHHKQYLSSTMTSNEYRDSVANMLYLGAAYSKRSIHSLVPPTEALHGTPLNESIIASIDIVSDFKKVNKLDLVNTIYLTDGQGSHCDSFVFSETGEIMPILKNDGCYIQHEQTKTKVRVFSARKDSSQDYFITMRALVDLAQKVTGAKYTGYLISRKKQIAEYVLPYEFSYVDYYVSAEQRKTLNKKIEKQGFYSSNQFGFSQYFFVLDSNINIEEQKIDVEVGAKKSQIAKAFAKSLNSRRIQRMFLNEFVQNIAA